MKEELSKLVEAGKFDFVDKALSVFDYEAPRSSEYKLFGADKVIETMEEEGYAPATYTELMEYANNGWDGFLNVIALGSTTGNPGMTEPHVYRVPALIGHEGSTDYPTGVRRAILTWASGWGDAFLAVKK